MEKFLRLLNELHVEHEKDVQHARRSPEGRADKIRTLLQHLKKRAQADAPVTPDKTKKVKSGMTKDLPDGKKEVSDSTIYNNLRDKIRERIATAQGRPKGMPRHEWDKKHPEAKAAAERGTRGSRVGQRWQGDKKAQQGPTAVDVPGQGTQAHAFGHGGKAKATEKAPEAPAKEPEVKKATPPPLPEPDAKKAKKAKKGKMDWSLLKRVAVGTDSGQYSTQHKKKFGPTVTGGVLGRLKDLKGRYGQKQDPTKPITPYRKSVTGSARPVVR